MLEALAAKTEINIASFSLIIPELILMAGICILLISSLIVKNKSQQFYFLLSLVVLLAAMLFVIDNISYNQQSLKLFNGMLQADSFSNLFKLFIAIAALLSLLMFWIERKNISKTAEQLSLLLSMSLGGMLLLSSANFIMLIISIELLSISSYLMVGFGFSKKSAVGSLKYLLFGAAATAVMIYGVSWIYGMSGTLEFGSEIFIQNMMIQSPYLYFVVGCIFLAGLLFKIAAVPMHLWAPDVYASSSSAVLALLASLPKIAGLGILTKIYYALHLFGNSPVNWQIIFILIATITIGVANLAALRQRDAKRLMAWSSVAQSGFMLIGILSNSSEGLEAMSFYIGIYLLANFLVMGLIQYQENQSGDTQILAFSGLGRNQFFIAIALTLGLIALTGLPPTAGFTAKLLIFTQLYTSWQLVPGSAKLFLLIFGLLNTVPALYYYLRIPYMMFFKEKSTQITSPLPIWLKIYFLLMLFLLLGLFLQPEFLMAWFNRVNFAL